MTTCKKQRILRCCIAISNLATGKRIVGATSCSMLFFLIVYPVHLHVYAYCVWMYRRGYIAILCATVHLFIRHNVCICACSILATMEDLLNKFQHDLGNISQEIRTLQQQVRLGYSVHTVRSTLRTLQNISRI